MRHCGSSFLRLFLSAALLVQPARASRIPTASLQRPSQSAGVFSTQALAADALLQLRTALSPHARAALCLSAAAAVVIPAIVLALHQAAIILSNANPRRFFVYVLLIVPVAFQLAVDLHANDEQRRRADKVLKEIAAIAETVKEAADIKDKEVANICRSLLSEAVKKAGDLSAPLYVEIVLAALHVEFDNPAIDDVSKEQLFSVVAERDWEDGLEPLYLAFLGKDVSMSFTAMERIAKKILEMELPREFREKAIQQIEEIDWGGIGADADRQVVMAKDGMHALIAAASSHNSPDDFRDAQDVFESLIWLEENFQSKYLENNNQRFEFVFEAESRWKITISDKKVTGRIFVIERREGTLIYVKNGEEYKIEAAFIDPPMQNAGHNLFIRVTSAARDFMKRQQLRLKFSETFADHETTIFLTSESPQTPANLTKGSSAAMVSGGPAGAAKGSGPAAPPPMDLSAALRDALRQDDKDKVSSLLWAALEKVPKQHRMEEYAKVLSPVKKDNLPAPGNLLVRLQRIDLNDILVVTVGRVTKEFGKILFHHLDSIGLMPWIDSQFVYFIIPENLRSDLRVNDHVSEQRTDALSDEIQKIEAAEKEINDRIGVNAKDKEMLSRSFSRSLIAVVEGAKDLPIQYYGQIVSSALRVKFSNQRIDDGTKLRLLGTVLQHDQQNDLQPLYLAFFGDETEINVAALEGILKVLLEKMPGGAAFWDKVRRQLDKIKANERLRALVALAPSDTLQEGFHAAGAIFASLQQKKFRFSSESDWNFHTAEGTSVKTGFGLTWSNGILTYAVDSQKAFLQGPGAVGNDPMKLDNDGNVVVRIAYGFYKRIVFDNNWPVEFRLSPDKKLILIPAIESPQSAAHEDFLAKLRGALISGDNLRILQILNLIPLNERSATYGHFFTRVSKDQLPLKGDRLIILNKKNPENLKFVTFDRQAGTPEHSLFITHFLAGSSEYLIFDDERYDYFRIPPGSPPDMPSGPSNNKPGSRLLDKSS